MRGRGIALSLIGLVLAGQLVHCTSALAAGMQAELTVATGTVAPLPNCVPYRAEVYNVAAETEPRVLIGVAPALASFRRAAYDDGGFWNPDLPERLTAPVTGRFALRLRVNFELDDRGAVLERRNRRLVFAVNERERSRRDYKDPPAAGSYWPTLESAVVLNLRAGQFVSVHTASGDDGPGEILASAVDLSMRRLCPDENESEQ